VRPPHTAVLLGSYIRPGLQARVTRGDDQAHFQAAVEVSDHPVYRKLNIVRLHDEVTLLRGQHIDCLDGFERLPDHAMDSTVGPPGVNPRVTFPNARAGGSRFAGDTSKMLLAEWRAWWKESGAEQLDSLLWENWDPFREDSFRADAGTELFILARRLHEGATLVDVQDFLHDLRRKGWPERMGRKWRSRDRAVARKVVAWYREATGEQPFKK